MRKTSTLNTLLLSFSIFPLFLDYRQIHSTRAEIKPLIVFKMCKTCKMYKIAHQTNQIPRWQHIQHQRLQLHRKAGQITTRGERLLKPSNWKSRSKISLKNIIIVFFYLQFRAIVDLETVINIDSIDVLNARWRRRRGRWRK